MKITASGGTDGASIVLFWPDNLSDDADAILQDDPVSLVERLRDEGKLIQFPCDADGAYSLAVFMNEAIPDELKTYCQDEQLIPKFVVRGPGYFGGMEYMFKHDSTFLKKHPHMGEQVQIPGGTYLARVYRTEVPDRVYQEWLVSQAGARAKRLWDLHGIVAACAIASVIFLLVAKLALPRPVWAGALAVTAALALATLVMSRTGWYRRVAKAKAEFEKEYPSYVVQLE